MMVGCVREMTVKKSCIAKMDRLNICVKKYVTVSGRTWFGVIRSADSKSFPIYFSADHDEVLCSVEKKKIKMNILILLQSEIL